jgi:hypothetical protein
MRMARRRSGTQTVNLLDFIACGQSGGQVAGRKPSGNAAADCNATGIRPESEIIVLASALPKDMADAGEATSARRTVVSARYHPG